MDLKLLLSIFYFLYSSSVSSSERIDDLRTYIIHMDESTKPDSFPTNQDWHASVLASVPTAASDGANIAPPSHLYTYSHVLSGFSAALSQSQLEHLERVPGYLSAQPDSYGQLHTTRTPEFLGLGRVSGLWPASRFGHDTIIGIIDTGIWPESASFSDEGMPPVPKRWKGECENGTEFSTSLCNRKIIGARSFSKGIKRRGANITEPEDYDSPRDYFGHGTHTSSTAAGSPVSGASYFGYAEGTATGIAPMARIAMYKALFAADSAADSAASDVLAAMDQAIADGVDLISLSLGFYKTPYYIDAIAIGAFAAMEKGIFVSCSAGNGGPHAYTVINGAPWLTSVGAGTIDRDYFATVSFGDSKRIEGRSLYPENLFVSNISLYFGYGNISKESCEHLALDTVDVSEKIVLCSANNDTNVHSQMLEISRTGAKGAIFVTDLGQYLSRRDFFMPFVAVSLPDGEVIKDYVTKSAAPTVDIVFVSTKLGVKPSPQIADFSSRGPSCITPGILKPDILAPGVNILAAWVPNRGFTPIGDDYLVTDYALVSGTSMASPHIIGIAAMLRSVHPEWSPAAIRSAMMTTADVTDNTGGRIIDTIADAAATPLDYGAGHVNPNKAVDPGLVYDIGADDYINYICTLNYSSNQMQTITRRRSYDCSGSSSGDLDLNYPSFAIILDTNSTSRMFKRTLTNVRDCPGSYRAVVNAPRGMEVAVEPKVLLFEGKGAKREFWMRVDINLEDEVRLNALENDYIGNYGFLSWVEIGGKNVVRSPIVSAFLP